MWKRSFLLLAVLLLAFLAIQTMPTALGAPQATPTPPPSYSLLIGTPFEDVRNITDAGVFNVVPGIAGGGLDTDHATLWSQDLIYDSAEPYDYFASVMVSGDFNGDGYPDVAVGIPLEDWESWDGLETVADAGAVNVIYNGPDGLTVQGHQFWTQNDTGVSVAEEHDEFGAALAVGDFNGDGYADLAVGAPYEDLEWNSQTITNTGVVIILYGSPNGLYAPGSGSLKVMLTQDDFPDLQSDVNDHFGATLTSGDFDADGLDDLIVGVPLESADVGVSEAGIVLEFHGDSVVGLDDVNFWQQGSAEANDHFGAALTTGDFNGDGADDLAVGTPDEDTFSTVDAGAIFIIYGKKGHGLTNTGAQEWWQDIIKGADNQVVDPSEAGDSFGYALTAGDFDGDGHDDLAVGIPMEDTAGLWSENRGAIQVLMGDTTGLTMGDGFILYGDLEDDMLGLALAAGDFDLDGHDDIAVGEPGWDSSYSNVGSVIILYGEGVRPLTFSHQTMIDAGDLPGNTAEAGDYLGSSLAVLPPTYRLYLPLVMH